MATQFPSQYATSMIVSSLTGGITFGFAANAIHVHNDGAGTAYFSLGSTVASTGSVQLSSGEDFVISNLSPFTGMGLYGSGTSSGIGPSVRVTAWGGG